MQEEQDRPRSSAATLIHRVLHPGKPAMRACTIVARNYLAQAEVLARSFKQYHPECPFAILVIDDFYAREVRGDGVELLNLTDIGLEPGDAYRMPMIYNVTELSTAVKPWLLRRFLNGETASVIYFDPDIEIFSPLYDLAELARKHSIVLTPHVTEPIPQDQLRLSESDILGSGIYNLGFIGIGPGSEPFLEWWAARLRRESVIDPTRMRFTDQRWIDFVPGLYPNIIVRDPGFNVAYWNLHSRTLKWEDGRYTVNGEPLRFFHYSGYNPDQPHLLSKHQGDKPRVLLSEHPGVARITKEYRKKLRSVGFNEANKNPYGFDYLTNGLKLEDHVRRIYREALAKFEKGDGAEPPSPLAPDGEAAFLDWLNEPMRPAPPLVTRFMMSIHEARPDLQSAFPEPLGRNAEAFNVWFVEYGQFEARVHVSLVPGEGIGGASPSLTSSNNTTPESDSPRINVCGYFRAELGVGEAARLLIAGLEATKVPYGTVTYDVTLNRQTHPFEEQLTRGGESDINIICVNADQTPVFGQKMGPQFYKGRHTIGVWFWEAEDFPALFQSGFDYVDEVWVATDFMRQTLLKVSPKPVFKFHLPIVIPQINETQTKSDLGFPDSFVFLDSFDFMSVLERKNPFGVITAFKRAFKKGDGPTLFIKTINGDKRILDLEKVKLAASGRPDIIVADGYVSAMEKNTMTARCDCYVSLHRSEGFGLTMAEAMALGRPVIATGYSGNMEFMTPDNSYLCSYDYCQIGSGAEPYLPSSRWAQPNLDEAAALMRRVYLHQKEASARGRRAAEDIRTLHSPFVAGGAIADRISAIRSRRARFGKLPPMEIIEQRLEAVEVAPRTVLRIAEEEKARLARMEERSSTFEKTAQSVNEGTSSKLKTIEESHAQLETGLAKVQALLGPFLESHAHLKTGLTNVERLVRSFEERTQHQGAATEASEEKFRQVEAHLKEQTERLGLAEANQVNIQHGLEHRLAVMEGLVNSFQAATSCLTAMQQDQGDLRRAIKETNETLAALQPQMAESIRTSDKLAGQIASLGNKHDSLASTMEDVRQDSLRLRTLENELGRFQQLIPQLQIESTRVPVLEVTLKNLSTRLNEITSHLEAVPYMSDPAALRADTPGGGHTIGYRGAGANGTDKDLYISFESIFRGSEEMIRERQRNYLDVLRKVSPVVDLGCGRGEMLDLLNGLGIPAVGVDLDPGMVARATAKGHKVVQTDAVQYLSEQADKSIGGIFCAQVVEHLPYEEMLKLLKLSRAKLKLDGVLIVETVNPHSHRALKTFWVDPTHNKPIFPEVLVALCRQLGFQEAMVRFPCGSGDFERDRLAEGEYAVVAKITGSPVGGKETTTRKNQRRPAKGAGRGDHRS